MRSSKLWRALALAGALTLVLGPAHVFGQDFPAPPENWWTQLKVGDSATWNMNMGSFQGTVKIAITALDGSQISFRTEKSMGGMTLPVEDQTVDAAVYDPEEVFAEMSQGGAMGEEGGASASLSQVGEEAVEVGGKTLNCVIYEIDADGQQVKSWYSPQLPPVFMGGSVKMEMSMMGMGEGTVQLVEFTGKPLN